MPSSFSVTSPNFFDHELDRDTLLTTDELFAIYDFINKGGKLIIDFGGTSRGNKLFDIVEVDSQSLESLLSLFGIGWDKNSDQLINGIPIPSTDNSNGSIGYVGSSGRMYIHNTRNWRDRDELQSTASELFVDQVFGWIINEEV
jgi:hypothetical protein